MVYLQRFLEVFFLFLTNHMPVLHTLSSDKNCRKLLHCCVNHYRALPPAKTNVKNMVELVVLTKQYI